MPDATASMTATDGEAALEVESRRPADLRVSDAVADHVLDELGGHSLERLGGLEQRDRQVEEGEQLGLVGALLGTDHAPMRLLEGERHADRRREIDRGRRPHGPVEVLVQLGLRERAQGIDGDHRPMIGTRAVISVAVTLVGLVVLIGPRDADPAAGLAAERLVRERAGVATDALDTLRATIQPGLDGARRAAAAVLSADEPPGSLLVAAGDTIAAADEAAMTARRAVAALNGARSALGHDLAPLAEPIAAGELPSIGAQLAAAAPAADAFFELRLRAGGLPEVLEAALAALDRGDLEAADELVTQARQDHAFVVASEAEPVTLPVWIATTDAMISAMEQIVSATLAGDAAAASAAAEAFRALTDDAATADRALRIAIGEGGSSLTAAPLERLAAALGGIEDMRAATAEIAAASDR